MFKALIFTSCAAAALILVLAGESDPKYQAAVVSCKPKFPNVTDEEIAAMCTDDYVPNQDDEKCFIQCTSLEMGFTDEDGNLVKDALLKTPPPSLNVDKIKGAIDGCIKITGKNDCDIAYLQWACLAKAAKTK